MLPLCLEYGMGPDEFDCSGLVLRALADVVGGEAMPDPRHCRQMWGDAQAAQLTFAEGEERPGNLAVFERRWDTLDGVKKVAGHIALVTEVSADGLSRIIHAQPSAGRVIEGPLRRNRLLGFLDLNHVN